jgi:hypothetical protein
MTGPGHYQRAEELIPVAQELMDNQQDGLAAPVLAMAQAHATLALAAATALSLPSVNQTWREVTS